MHIERIFEIPPLTLQHSQGLRPGYLYYASDDEDHTFEGCGKTPAAAIQDLRATKTRLRTRVWYSFK